MSTPQPKPNSSIDDVTRHSIGFLLLLGRALHIHGYPSHRLESVMEQGAERLGLVGQFFSTPTSIFAAFGAQDNQQTFLMRVAPGEVNLGKLAELDKVACGVLDRKLNPKEGSARVEKILAEPHPYGPVLTTLAYGIASGAASRILGGGLREIAVSGLIGFAIGFLLIAMEKYRQLGKVFEPLAAFIASALATAVSFLIWPYAVSNATLAGLIVLMPGLTLTTAMLELTAQHLSSGTARLNKAFVIFLGIGFGVAVGSTIVEAMIGAARIAKVVPLPGWTEALALLVMPLSFTIILRAHLRDAVWIVIAGALSVAGARIGANWLGSELGVFLGALIVGIASNWYARLLDRPAIITQTPGLLLLVPGSVGFKGLAALLDKQIVSGVDTTFKMILTAVALVAGTLIANIVAPSRREI